MKELIDDSAFDPEKLFNEKEYRTLMIGRTGYNTREDDAIGLVADLLDGQLTRPETEDILRKLKEKNAQKVMVESINAVNNASDRARILAACWESGLDFSAYFGVFVSLACSSDYATAMEAFTVIENCEGDISRDILEEAVKTVRSAKDAQPALAEDLLKHLEQRLSNG